MRRFWFPPQSQGSETPIESSAPGRTRSSVLLSVPNFLLRYGTSCSGRDFGGSSPRVRQMSSWTSSQPSLTSGPIQNLWQAWCPPIRTMTIWSRSRARLGSTSSCQVISTSPGLDRHGPRSLHRPNSSPYLIASAQGHDDPAPPQTRPPVYLEGSPFLRRRCAQRPTLMHGYETNLSNATCLSRGPADSVDRPRRLVHPLP